MEFFTSVKEWELIKEKIKEDKHISFYAANNEGGFMTNMDEGAANTVTWGVFPGKEIVQPTIIEEVSFLAWKVLHLYDSLTLGRGLRDLGRVGKVISHSIRDRQAAEKCQGSILACKHCAP